METPSVQWLQQEILYIKSITRIGRNGQSWQSPTYCQQCNPNSSESIVYIQGLTKLLQIGTRTHVMQRSELYPNFTY